MITDGRILRQLARAGYIEWSDARERHWTGMTVKRRWVREGPKLKSWSDTFTHRGVSYRLRYVDGCFHPFVFKIGEQPPAFI